MLECESSALQSTFNALAAALPGQNVLRSECTCGAARDRPAAARRGAPRDRAGSGLAARRRVLTAAYAYTRLMFMASLTLTLTLTLSLTLTLPLPLPLIRKSPKSQGRDGEGGAPPLPWHASLLPWHGRADGERELTALTACAAEPLGLQASRPQP